MLDSLYDAFFYGASNFTSTQAACLHWVGVSMPHDIDKVTVLDISAVIDVLKADLQGPFYCVLPTTSRNLWCSPMYV